ncbi:UNKNOWN [Stylonychia lemnae]|uniref:Uncharacterized protein n=1 Tax=Stylonychia lemnae TaxID=5949 RepID=A0A078A7N2_STYLE|nr:UNKNOWN [Stylonychia lemnae]|eukprot:CDW76791.1 UNKNOWN [Stylonychia lemnae]
MQIQSKEDLFHQQQLYQRSYKTHNGFKIQLLNKRLENLRKPSPEPEKKQLYINKLSDQQIQKILNLTNIRQPHLNNLYNNNDIIHNINPLENIDENAINERDDVELGFSNTIIQIHPTLKHSGSRYTKVQKNKIASPPCRYLSNLRNKQKLRLNEDSASILKTHIYQNNTSKHAQSKSFMPIREMLQNIENTSRTQGELNEIMLNQQSTVLLSPKGQNDSKEKQFSPREFSSNIKLLSKDNSQSFTQSRDVLEKPIQFYQREIKKNSLKPKRYSSNPNAAKKINKTLLQNIQLDQDSTLQSTDDLQQRQNSLNQNLPSIQVKERYVNFDSNHMIKAKLRIKKQSEKEKEMLVDSFINASNLPQVSNTRTNAIKFISNQKFKIHMQNQLQNHNQIPQQFQQNQQQKQELVPKISQAKKTIVRYERLNDTQKEFNQSVQITDDQSQFNN